MQQLIKQESTDLLDWKLSAKSTLLSDCITIYVALSSKKCFFEQWRLTFRTRQERRVTVKKKKKGIHFDRKCRIYFLD